MSSQETATPPPAAPQVRRLTRRRDGKIIAGVCSGLADYTGLDPIIFRIIFVGLVFAGGSGLLLYALAWLFVPEAGSGRAYGHDLLGRFQSGPWLGTALLILGGVLLLAQINVFSPPIRWGIVLLVLGFILFHEHGSGGTPQPRSDAPARRPYEMQTAATSPDAATTAVLPPAAVAAPRPPRERSALGWYTIAAALLALGIAALLDASNSVHIKLVQYLALPLAVIGGGLVVGAWRGRSRLLIVLGILLVPFVLTASLIQVPLTGDAGTFLYRPQTTASIPPDYHIAAGELTVDLRRLALGSGTTTIAASVGVGQLRIIVPPRVPIHVVGLTDLGGVTVFGRSHAGTNVSVETTSPAPSSAPGLYVHLHTGLGAVSVQRVARNAFVPAAMRQPAALPRPPAPVAPFQP